MRHRIPQRHLHLARSRVLAGVAAALLAVIAVIAVVAVVAGCSSDAATAPTSPVAAPGSVVPRDAAQPMARSAPVGVHIPAIGVDSTLMQLGLRADGSLQVPPSGFPAGWYTGAPTPGELGPAILAGHVDWSGQPGVFSRLRELTPDAQVTVTRQDGSAAVFRVTQVKQYPKDKFPTSEVYGDLDHPGLRLITCGGSFDRQTRNYEDNIIAFADLVATHPASPA
jgi:sortase (surface protein transpeptidase)